MSINISNCVQFLNVINNQASVDMSSNSYIKELEECVGSASGGCCGREKVIQRNCDHKLYSIIDEALTNDPDLKSKIKEAFDGAEIIFALQGKSIVL